MRTFIRIILPAAIIFFSCKTSRKVVESPSAVVKLKGVEVIQAFDSVKANEFVFNFLTAKAEVAYTDKRGETNAFDINLRIKRDSAIWVSITPLLGIELARALIRPDSIIVLDRLNKQFMKRDYKYFEEWLNTKVNYDMIQAVMVGNYFQYQDKEKLKSLYEDDPYVILSTLNKRQARRAMEEKDPNKPFVQDFWIDGNYRIAKSRIADERRDRWVEATYKNFTDVSGRLFPNNIVLTVASTTPAIININYKKAELTDSLSMPFSVPEKYVAK